MNKRIYHFLISFLIVLLVMFCFSSFHNNYAAVHENSGLNNKNTDILKNSLEVSGAEFASMDSNGWACINDSFLSDDNLNQMLDSSIKYFKINNAKTSISRKGNEYCQVQGSGIGEDCLYFNISLYSGHTTDRGTYLSVNIQDKSGKYSFSEIENLLNRFFSIYKKKPTVSFSISGVIEKKICFRDMKEIRQRIFSAAGAKYVEGIEQNGFISVSGYTDRININAKESNGQYVNIQAALRSGIDDNKTYVIVGVPVITIEY